MHPYGGVMTKNGSSSITYMCQVSCDATSGQYCTQALHLTACSMLADAANVMRGGTSCDLAELHLAVTR